MSGDVSQLPTVTLPPLDLSYPLVGGEPAPFLGGLYYGGHQTWRVMNNTLVINEVSSGKYVQLWTPVLTNARITHVSEYDLRSPDGPLFVVVLETCNQWILTVVSPLASKLIRAVTVPYRITTVHPISTFGTPISDSNSNAPQSPLFGDSILSYFSGVVAIGCTGGRVLLIDLHLRSQNMYPVTLLSPSALQLVGGVATQEEVEGISESGGYACVLVTNATDSQFIFNQKALPSSFVTVTSLHFTPQINCLFVGYSFGGFQIYDTSSLSLVFSSAVPQIKPLPAVTHFTFIEPENDPRGFVYVWVARGRSELAPESTNCETKLLLYQMVFQEKLSPSKTHQVSYRSFQTCGPRMEYALTPNPSVPNPLNSVGVSLIKCFTPLRYHTGHGTEGHELDLSTSVFVWRCGGSHDQADYIMSVFDINQWYHAQMPNILRWKRSGKYTGVLGSSYFAFFSLRPALESLSLGGAEITDVCVKDVLPFSQPPPVPESHMWPTALQFDVMALCSNKLLSCQYQGLPRSALRELDVCRGILYAQPERVFNMCVKADLLQPGWEHSVPVVDLQFQRRALLEIAVDFGSPNHVLTSFIDSWLGSEFNDPNIVEWISTKLAAIVQQKRELCAMVSGGSSSEVLRMSLWQQVSAIQHFLEKILSHSSESDDHHAAMFSSLSDLCYTAMMHKNVLHALSFFTERGGDSSSSVKPFNYPYPSLAMRYDFLRKGDREQVKLVVDHVCDELKDLSDLAYPPPSLEGVMDIFLTPHTSIHQHFMMVYMMCDLISVDVMSDDVIAEYGRSHDLPCDLVAVCRGLWALDNQKYKDKQFEHEMNLLLQKLDVPLFPWQHSVVATSLLSTNQIALSLSYIQLYGYQMQTSEEVKLRVAILVWAGHIHEAFDLMNQYEGTDGFEELFDTFLETCYESKTLHLILEHSFTDYQEELFVDYLNKHSSLVVKEMAVFYYLIRHEYAEALRVHKKIKPLAKSHPDPKAMQRCSERELLLAGFYSAIPTPLHPIIERDQRDTPPVTIRAEPGSALSSVVAKQVHAKVGSQAGVIYNSLQALAEKRNKDVGPMTPFRRTRERRGQAPFLSTPVSVKKARADTSRLLTPAPSRSLSVTPDPTTMTPVNPQMKILKEHMQGFRERMDIFNQSRTTALDVQTPVSTPKAPPVLTTSLHSTSNPPSILKTKTGDGSDTRTTGTENKKIRFAEEGPQVTPFLEKTTRHLPSRFTPAQTSSLVTTASIAAAQTPLPSSDDSDLFQSPVQSPSDWNEPTPISSSSPVKPSPGRSSAAEQSAFSEALDEAAEVEAREKKGEGEEEEEKMEKDVEMCDESVASKSAEKQTLDESDQEEEMVQDRKSFSKETREIKTASPAMKELMSQLTRRSITPGASFNVTPRRGRGGGGHTPSSSLRGTTSSLPTSTVPSAFGSSSTFAQATPKPATSFFSPIPKLEDLLAAKEQKLKKSFETARRQEIARIMGGSPRVETSSAFSSTMVPQVRVAETNVEPAPSTTLKGTQYSFSPPAEMRVAPDDHPSMISPPPPATGDKPHPADYVFSPPLTRSAARKLRGEESSSGDTSLLSQLGGEEEEEGGGASVAVPKKRGRGRPRKSTSATPERSLPPSDPVILVSPPSHSATPTLIPREPRGQRRKTKAARTAVGTRRSHRLLMAAKK